MLSAPLSSGAAGAIDIGAVGAVVADECVIRETDTIAAWYSWDRRRCKVAFVRPTMLQGGIRETNDIERCH